MIPPHHLADDQVGFILYGDLALAVVHAQHRLVLTTLLDNDAHFPLVVVTVNARVLSQGDTCLVRGRIVVEDGVFAEGLEDPGDGHILDGSRSAVVTLEDHSGE